METRAFFQVMSSQNCVRNAKRPGLGTQMHVGKATVVCFQGNCQTTVRATVTQLLPPYAAPLQALNPGQCLILSHSSVFGVERTRVWLQGLYIRMVPPRGGAEKPMTELIPVGLDSASVPAEVWMNGVTLQGNGGLQQECESCGMRMRNAKIYAEGTEIFSHAVFGPSTQITGCCFYLLTEAV
jgi:hypothetical protein